MEAFAENHLCSYNYEEKSYFSTLFQPKKTGRVVETERNIETERQEETERERKTGWGRDWETQRQWQKDKAK